MITKEHLFIAVFLFLFFILYYFNSLTTHTLKENLDTIEGQNGGCSSTEKDHTMLTQISKNSASIDVLREQMEKIKTLENDIQSMKQNIDDNTEALKAMADSQRQSANDSLNMNVENDGNVYDEDGNALYEEK